ncbi:MAG TPA: hypothetical protein VJM08_14215 [Anaerolineales bacterium]|nr:hypothetical protein [Anaerolineales bacterium]
MRIFRLILFVGICCFLIGLSYLVVLRLSLAIWNSPLNPFYQPEIGLDPNSAMFLAVPLMAVPYILGGIFLGLYGATRYAVPIGLVTTISERLLIFTAAAYVLGQFRQVTETGEVYYVAGGPDLVMAIRGEALPYFSWSYIILGVPISILILHLTARRIEQVRNRRIAAARE